VRRCQRLPEVTQPVDPPRLADLHQIAYPTLRCENLPKTAVWASCCP